MTEQIRCWTDTTLAAWRAACSDDTELSALAVNASVTFAVRSGDQQAAFTFRAGVLAADPADDLLDGSADDVPAYILAAAPEAWAKFFQPVPPPAYQNFFGMRMRVASATVEGSELAMAQHAHISRRVLELGRAAISGGTVSSGNRDTMMNHPTDAIPSKTNLRSGYVGVTLDGQILDLFYESVGEGQDVVLLHTAGADSRQYHDLMADPALTSRCRMFAFDLPGHGRSDLLPNTQIGDYSLTTEQYAQVILAVIDALALQSPVVSGSSMGGEICLELAYRASHKNGVVLSGVIACESSDNVPGRKVNWAKHPLVNESVFVPEWVYGLMAPQSPEHYRRKVWWGYSQGGFGTFAGDIDFYSDDWDGRDRVGRIDTALCPVVMMTGEYDYSCTPAMSEATAKKIPGAIFWSMPELGHFPMAENPPLFARHFARALDQLGV